MAVRRIVRRGELMGAREENLTKEPSFGSHS
jgi:hypothetical protein